MKGKTVETKFSQNDIDLQWFLPIIFLSKFLKFSTANLDDILCVFDFLRKNIVASFFYVHLIQNSFTTQIKLFFLKMNVVNSRSQESLIYMYYDYLQKFDKNLFIFSKSNRNSGNLRML